MKFKVQIGHNLHVCIDEDTITFIEVEAILMKEELFKGYRLAYLRKGREIISSGTEGNIIKILKLYPDCLIKADMVHRDGH